VVLKAGSDVKHVKEGDSVVVTWVQRDAANTDRRPQFSELEVSAGLAKALNVFTWADHTLVDEQFVVKVNPDLKKDVTAIVGCAVITGAGAVAYTAKVQAGETVAIFGVGGVGLAAVAAAKKVGASKIIAVDITDEKLEFAAKFGATHLVNAAKEDPVEAIHRITVQQGRYTNTGNLVSGADYAFDCIGIKQTMEQILPSCRTGQRVHRKGGTAVLIGVPNTTVELSAADIVSNEKSFIGSLGGTAAPCNTIPTFIEWYSRGDLDLDSLVTARYTLDQINEAVSALENGKIAGRAIIEF
jgi:Zn-dependent alcohol dehydrogenase